MWEQVIDSFRRAASANRSCSLRRGNVIRLPDGSDALVAGDLHGHGPNLLKIERLADLDSHPARHVVLQELIHCSGGEVAADNSHHIVARSARWQLRYPGRVHVILGNHELAQMAGQEIIKNGAGICKAFSDAVLDHYGDDGPQVLDAMLDYFRSLPLAVRTDGGVAVVHSLPAERQADAFDGSVFDRSASQADLSRDGPAYQLVWGRSFGGKSLEAVKSALDARRVIIGHIPQPEGLSVASEDLLVITSDHALGVAVLIKSGQAPDAATMASGALRLNEVAI